jgi:hypothetical protein
MSEASGKLVFAFVSLGYEDIRKAFWNARSPRRRRLRLRAVVKRPAQGSSQAKPEPQPSHVSLSLFIHSFNFSPSTTFPIRMMNFQRLAIKKTARALVIKYLDENFGSFFSELQKREKATELNTQLVAHRISLG